MQAAGRRRAGHDRRRRRRRASTTRRRRHVGHLRRRRGRRRDDRRRRPADADRRSRKRMAGEFFGNVDAALAGGPAGRPGPARSAALAPPPGAAAAAAPTARRRRLHRARRAAAARRPAAGRLRSRASCVGAAAACWPASSSALDLAAGGADDRPRRRLAPRARWSARRARAGRSRRASCSTCTWPGSPSATRELNAVVSLDEERARAGAAEADERLARGEPGGAAARAAVRVQGHPRGGRLADDVRLAAARRLRARARRADRRADPRRRRRSSIGKTNVPEFAAGSHTFNPVFGTTLNPVDLTRSAGGSSGGAACALASGHGAAGRRQRHGRLAAQPGVVLQRRRACGPSARPGARRGRTHNQLGDHLGRRPDGPQRRATSRCCCR